MRENKAMERFRDSEKSGNALEAGEQEKARRLPG
jgi:hypothetical protein